MSFIVYWIEDTEMLRNYGMHKKKTTMHSGKLSTVWQVGTKKISFQQAFSKAICSSKQYLVFIFQYKV